jgi:CHAD domain-containing protein
MRKAIRKAVEKDIVKFYDYKTAALTFKDPEDLHQMRVAGRRLLSFLYVLADQKEAKKDGFRKMRKPLKKAMGALGELRDSDVLLEEVEKRLPGFSPARQKAIKLWLEQKRTDQEELRLKLSESLPDTVDKDWKKDADDWAETRISELADKQLMAKKLEELRNEKAASMDAILQYGLPDMKDERFLNLLHKGRISAKKLRYALSVAEKFMDGNNEEIEALKTLQDQMGHIQDMRVWINQLNDFYKTKSPSGRIPVVVNNISDVWRGEMLETLQKTGIVPG